MAYSDFSSSGSSKWKRRNPDGKDQIRQLRSKDLLRYQTEGPRVESRGQVCQNTPKFLVLLNENLLKTACAERQISLIFAGESFGLLRGVRNPMTRAAASRIQSATAKRFGGGVPKGSFSSRAQSTADRRAFWNIY